MFVIEGGTVIDGTGSGPQEGWSIVIGDGRIVELGPSQQIRRPDDATVVDATGKFIIPGLTDSHVHYYGYEAELFLAHGVTSVLLLGGVYEWEIAQRDAIARGEMIGPMIFTAGNPLGGPISTPPQGTPSTGPSTGLASLPHSISVHNALSGEKVCEIALPSSPTELTASIEACLEEKGAVVTDLAQVRGVARGCGFRP